jgi:hypothetical protein
MILKEGGRGVDMSGGATSCLLASTTQGRASGTAGSPHLLTPILSSFSLATWIIIFTITCINNENW